MLATGAALAAVGAPDGRALPLTTESGAVTEYIDVDGTAWLAPTPTDDPGALAVYSVDEIGPGAVGTYPIEGGGATGATVAAALLDALALAADVFLDADRTEPVSPAVFFVFGLTVPIASAQSRLADPNALRALE